MKTDDNEASWQQFVNDKLKKGLRTDDIRDVSLPFPVLQECTYKESTKILKGYLSDDGYRRCNDRYRQFKRRSKSNLSTISIRTETLDKLKSMAVKSGFAVDGYDLMLEYLMSPENELEEYKSAAEITGMPTGLSIVEQRALIKTKLRLRASTWRLVMSQIEYAFNAGWLACKYLQGKKRTEKAQGEATKSFIGKVNDFY